ncbi:E3 ubiquitin-protein ligase TRIM45-like isoform X1 [Sycon ciliatum]|uniref:E3 ubiquitin-protein ligase TRIM45-like isoform X1 n=1 Tax=Sycon ciliatum TaxID=27933 RepID=UPI0031F66E45
MSSERVCCVSCGGTGRRLKLVSCLHSVCVACLEEHIHRDGYIKCPKCISKTPIPTVAFPLTHLPDSYPKYGDETGASATNVQVMCDDCAEDEHATARCEDCGANLCSAHAHAHPRNRATRNHKLTSLSAEQQETATERGSIQHYCAVHPRQVLSRYCVQCNQLACQKCMDTGAHSDTDTQHQVLSIEAAAQKMRETVDGNISSCISDSEGVISSALGKVQAEISTVNDDAEFASKEITEQFNLLKKVLEAREKTLLDKVDRQKNGKLVQLEAQVCRLQDSLFHGQAVSTIFKTCSDQTDFLKIAHWLNSAIDQRKNVTEKDAEPCVHSHISYVGINAKNATKEIEEIGKVVDFTQFSDALTVSAQDTRVNANMRIVLKGAPLPVPFEECADRLRFKISVHDGSHAELPVTELQQVSSDCLESRGEQQLTEETGQLTVSVQYGERHVQGSPMQVRVTHPAQPVFDQSRCHEDITISNAGHTVRRALTSGYRSVCTSSIPTTHGTSSIRLRIDKTYDGDMYICACSATVPRLDDVHSVKTEIFGWNGYWAGYTKGNGGQLGQSWVAGDIISLELDHDNQTLTGHHERTGSREVLHGITGTCCWYVCIHDTVDQVTIL